MITHRRIATPAKAGVQHRAGRNGTPAFAGVENS